MAKSLNKVQLIGHLGRDPEMKFTPSGKQVTQGTIAMNRSWKDEGGTQHEETEWVNWEAWGRAAEIINQYAGKGSKMYLEGAMRTDRYTPQGGGEEKFFTKVVVREFMFLGSNGNGAPTGPMPAEPAAEAPAEDEFPF